MLMYFRNRFSTVANNVKVMSILQWNINCFVTSDRLKPLKAIIVVDCKTNISASVAIQINRFTASLKIQFNWIFIFTHLRFVSSHRDGSWCTASRFTGVTFITKPPGKVQQSPQSSGDGTRMRNRHLITDSWNLLYAFLLCPVKTLYLQNVYTISTDKRVFFPFYVFFGFVFFN